MNAERDWLAGLLKVSIPFGGEFNPKLVRGRGSTRLLRNLNPLWRGIEYEPKNLKVNTNVPVSQSPLAGN